jgi:DHA1 family multidrug resistance protein-like MFS transporter
MQEEDYEILRGEARAEPERYSHWDTQGEFPRQYAERHNHDPNYADRIRTASVPEAQTPVPNPTREEIATLSRHSSSSSSSSSSSASSISRVPTLQLEEIRTQQSAGVSTRERDQAGTASTGVDAGPLYRHPTERHPGAIRRINTHRSQHALTVGGTQNPTRLTRTLSRRATRGPLPDMGADKPFPPLLPDREEYVVEYSGVDDPLHAENWPFKKKIWIGAILAFDALAVSMGSSIFSSGIRPVAQEFGVIAEVTTLGTSLYVFGYAFGPLVSTITSTALCFEINAATPVETFVKANIPTGYVQLQFERVFESAN